VHSAAGRGQGADVALDLRVDDHADPVGELSRLHALGEPYFGTPGPGSVLPLAGDLADEVAARVTALGQPSLTAWMQIENYEARLVDGCATPRRTCPAPGR